MGLNDDFMVIYWDLVVSSWWINGNLMEYAIANNLF